MGQEIDHIDFTAAQYSEFRRRLRAETAALIERFSAESTRDDDFCAGFEIEACLVEPDTLAPAMCNQAFLTRLDSPLASAELARHNVEFNTIPRAVSGSLLSALHREFRRVMDEARPTAEALGKRLILCGILPTLEPGALTLANISPLNRYYALNRQVVAAHIGTPFRLEIKGREHLLVEQSSVMLEAAATSMQIHLRTPQSQVRRAYNAALLVSAPVVAIGANSPLLFRHDLWDETRIPVFEQSVGLGGYGGGGPLHRVSFGSGYARRSVLECFEENLEHYPVLLPILDDSDKPFAHLALHNGTIWRWNRPIVGFDPDGTLHIRIEHRSLPAGPSLTDGVANSAFFLGLLRYYIDRPVEALEFALVRNNFYEAARQGMHARIDWLDGVRHPLARLALRQLLAEARAGLDRLGVDGCDAEHYLGVIEARLKCGQNGAGWQRRFLAAYPGAFAALTRAYLAQQCEDLPVHLWEV